jgi:hypothetical protein
MDIHKLAALFNYEPVLATLLFVVITITAVAIAVGVYVAAFGLWHRIRSKRADDSGGVAAA